MSFIKDNFFGGAERQAGEEQAAAATAAADTRATGFREGIEPRVTGLETAIGTLTPHAEGGMSAFQMQLAQSGALGPEAQQEFFDNFKRSPGTEFRLGEARRFVESGGDAFGGSGGGNRLRRLHEIGLGMLQSDLTSQFNQLGTLSGTGFNATRNIAGLETAIGDVEGRGIEGAAGAEGIGLQESAAATASGILGSAGAVRGTVKDIGEGIGKFFTMGAG